MCELLSAVIRDIGPHLVMLCMHGLDSGTVLVYINICLTYYCGEERHCFPVVLECLE